MLHIMKIPADYPEYENACQYICFKRIYFFILLFYIQIHMLYNGDPYMDWVIIPCSESIIKMHF